MKNFLTNNKGQSLWEVIIALAVAGLVAVGLVRVTTSAVGSVRFSRDQSQITTIGQKKLTEIKNYVNLNPSLFWKDFQDPYNPAANLPITTELLSGFPTFGYLATDTCTAVAVTNASLQLPTDAPGYGTTAIMAKVEVKVFWERKGEETSCQTEDNYNHFLLFTTYISKED